MEPDGDSPPIWSPPSTLFVPVRRRSRLSSILNPVTLTIFISVVLILIIFFLLPRTLSRNNQVLKPDSSVKKSWNSINIFLVLFAVLCGVFARRNDETSSSDGAETVPNAYEFVNSGRQSVSGAYWLESPDRKAYDKTNTYTTTGGNRLRRSSSSYPDLRRESLWGSDGEKLKYFDDFELDFHHPPGNFHRHVRQSREVEKDVAAETSVREIPVDKFELKYSILPPPTQPITQVPQPPPPPPLPVKRRRSVHSVPKQYNVERGGREAEFNEKRSSLPPPSKTPPPPSELKFHPLAERSEKIQRKKSGTTKEIATAAVSLYQDNQKKSKKKVKSRDIFEIVAQNPSPPTVPALSSIPSVPPPPPPPSPSKKVLQNFFKKSSKTKRVHSVSSTNPPPPPPPPPPRSIFNNIFKTGSKSKRLQLTSASSKIPPPPPPPSSIFNSLFKNGTKIRRLKYIETQPPPPPLPPTPRSHPKHSPGSTGKPPKPTKPSTSHHESVVIAPASPLIHMPPPPPPPPPPFRMPEMKFTVKGDFVRIRSANSSRCSSPGREDFDVMSGKSNRGDSIGPAFTCPSSDVDSKADTFISKHRDEWRLEKINSLKEQRNTGSWSARFD